MTRPTLYIDFETRSEVDLKACGPHVYAAHPSTLVLCICWAVDDGPIKTWLLGEDCPEDIERACREGWRIVAHNTASFERIVWRAILHARMGWPLPVLEQWDCTMARALALGLPRGLDQLGRVLGLPVVKDSVGHRLMLQMCKPKKGTGGDTGVPAQWVFTPEKLTRLAEYCATDVEVTRPADKILPPLQPDNRASYLFDIIMNDRGLRIDPELVGKAGDVVGEAIDRLDRRMQLVTGGAVTKCSQVARLASWCATRGVVVSSLGKDAVADLLKLRLPPAVEMALQLRLEAAKSSTGKLVAFADRVSDDGRMRDNLLWHGAHTGRWAGKGAQLQNLPRGIGDDAVVEDAIAAILSGTDAQTLNATIDEGVMAAVSSSLRGCIISDPDKELMVADYAAVEARGTAWLTGHKVLNDKFLAGDDVYKWMATMIYGKHVDAIIKVERQLGKTAILGCGYGMGRPKFHATCAKAGINIPLSLAETTVDIYREANKPIVDGWYDLQRGAVEAIRTPHRRVDVFGGKIRFLHDGTHLWMRLPSGRRLCYWRAFLAWNEETMREEICYWGVNSFTKKWTVERTWGGKLMENAVQALCRDLMAHGMMAVDAAGYDVILTVHDEVVSEVPIGFGSIEEFVRLLSTPPAWAEGFALAAEGWRGARYKK